MDHNAEAAPGNGSKLVALYTQVSARAIGPPLNEHWKCDVDHEARQELYRRARRRLQVAHLAGRYCPYLAMVADDRAPCLGHRPRVLLTRPCWSGRRVTRRCDQSGLGLACRRCPAVSEARV